MIKPKKVEIKDIDGNKCMFTIHRMDAMTCREIMAKYPLSSLPKIGDYEVNETTMLKMLGFVEVKKEDKTYVLDTKAMINNHVPDGETLLKLEYEMLSYNVSFLNKGVISNFLTSLKAKIPDVAQKILMQSLQSLSKKS